MIRPNCKYCGRPAKSKGYTPSGTRKWKNICGVCYDKKRRGIIVNSFDRVKCDKCDFLAIHPCQLDIDHIDGNSRNNSPENLQTLCANCHRLKTFINKDWQEFKEIRDKQLKLF